VELVGYEDEEAGNSNCEVRSLRLQSWEVHVYDKEYDETTIIYKQGCYKVLISAE
jgi:hypothetical protein